MSHTKKSPSIPTCKKMNAVSSLKSEIKYNLFDLMSDFEGIYKELREMSNPSDFDAWINSKDCPYYGWDKQLDRMEKILKDVNLLGGGK